jgi:CheY-like chemotaxis protein
VVETNVPFTLLIVDRDNGFRELVKRHVGRSVVVVGEACDGYEAVHMAKRLHPDVVLMEIAAPILDGVEAARRIKADRAETKVILLSSGQTAQLSGVGRICRAVVLHADAVIAKDRILSDLPPEQWSTGARRRRLHR